MEAKVPSVSLFGVFHSAADPRKTDRDTSGHSAIGIAVPHQRLGLSDKGGTSDSPSDALMHDGSSVPYPVPNESACDD